MLGCYPRFGRVLELGCGSGVASLHLTDYADEVEATEVDFGKVVVKDTPRVRFSQMDAQDMSRFADASFDLVFSSNVMEHISAIERCLAESRRVVRPGGYVVLTVPTNTWKAFSLALHYPAALAALPGRALRQGSSGPQRRNALTQVSRAATRRRGFIPRPHGVASTHLDEVRRWQSGRWKRLFAEAGFEVVRTVRLPFYYGHGRRFTILLWLGNAAGLSACTGYVLAPSSDRCCGRPEPCKV